MKITVNIFLCLIAILLSCVTCLAQNKKLNFVKLEAVSFDIETVFDISCEQFENTFNEHHEKTKNTISNTNDLTKFQSLTKEFKLLTKKQSFDVRGKIEYHYGITIEKYCFDVFGVFYKDGKLYYNKKLLIYITDKLYKHHPHYLDTLRYHE
ncbi:hypothetical protein NAF19_26970 [Mucilaginibacter sp. RT5R15]|nr:hypothetical protein [Mucilaginibacter flavidus]